jgi:DNA-binding beta-propeller fold protein YncE
MKHRILVSVAAILLASGARFDANTPTSTALIHTIAGTGTGGYSGDDVPAAAAQLNSSMDAATDAAGNVYICDSANNRIRKIDAATGTITTVAGNGQDGGAIGYGDGGPATAARLNYPSAIALDLAGNIYIADQWSWSIRKVTAATGIISHYARLERQPMGVAVDTAGNVFATLQSAGWVVKIAPGGAITKVAGRTPVTMGSCQDEGLPATQGCLNWPMGIDVDAAGNLYIADTDNCRVARVSAATGILTKVAGSVACLFLGDGGLAHDAFVNRPRGVAVSGAGDVYIADTGNHRIRRVSVATGIISTITGNGTSGFAGDGGDAMSASLGTVAGIALDAAGRLLIVDQGNQRVREVSYPDNDQPFAADVDGDGRADLIVWRPGTGTWYWLTSSSGYDYAASGAKAWGSKATHDVPLVADIDGDRRADFLYWTPATGTWHWVTSSTGYSDAAAGQRIFGDTTLGDEPLTGDVDGDGRADLVLWRASTGTWYWLLSTTGYADASLGSKQWGSSMYGDTPLLADFDGDGKADLTVWRARSDLPYATGGLWYWLTSSTGYDYAQSNVRQWGCAAWGDLPIVTDMDGDGQTDPAVWRGLSDLSYATGALWYWLPSASGYLYSGDQVRQWGVRASGDTPIAADFDGDRKTDLAVWRASTGTWYWVMSADGYNYAATQVVQWGSTWP